jgi:cysteine-rich repeat protein
MFQKNRIVLCLVIGCILFSSSVNSFEYGGSSFDRYPFLGIFENLLEDVITGFVILTTETGDGPQSGGETGDPTSPGGSPEICDNDIDDDLDLDIDCQDADCDTDPACITPAEICDNNIDDDYDTLVDCDDYSDCSNAPNCVQGYCGDGNVDPGEDCDDGNNVDGDGCDSKCKIEDIPDGGDEGFNDGMTIWDNFFNEDCGDGSDNDDDGDVDCDDEDCKYDSYCYERDCYDYFDNDYDGYTDCDDSDCSLAEWCYGYYGTIEICNDFIDNDDDGYVDCGDGDCMGDYACTEQIGEDCSNEVDDDQDGLIDCGDSDCLRSDYCTGAPLGAFLDSNVKYLTPGQIAAVNERIIEINARGENMGKRLDKLMKNKNVRNNPALLNEVKVRKYYLGVWLGVIAGLADDVSRGKLNVQKLRGAIKKIKGMLADERNRTILTFERMQWAGFEKEFQATNQLEKKAD